MLIIDHKIILFYLITLHNIVHTYAMYKLRFCTSCNLYKRSVQAATYTNSLYKLQLVWVDLYKLQLVQILDLYKLQLVQAPYLSVEKCILMNLYFILIKSTYQIFMNNKFTVNYTFLMRKHPVDLYIFIIWLTITVLFQIHIFFLF